MHKIDLIVYSAFSPMNLAATSVFETANWKIGSNAYEVTLLSEHGGIIRNRMKIEAAVRNARAFLKVQEEFGKFDSYCWRFVDGRPKLNRWKTTRQIPARSLESEKLSKDLKDRGFNFVGPTVAYAYMQAIGMVNDHTVDCFCYREITREFTNAK